jgi:hypothetical protein
MAFNPLGLQPRLRDGVRAQGLVTRSAAGPDSSGAGENKGYTGAFRRFTATTPMIVQAPGAAPFSVMPQRLASREKYAVVGMRLPLTVSPDLRKLRIEWDEVPTIDELIERGAPTFTNPDAVAAELEAAWAQVAAHAGGNPPRRMARAPIDGPNARVMAVGHGANDHEAILGKWELLLSVSLPGRPRFGYRWKKKVPRGRIVFPGTDIPIRVDGDEIEIPWDELGSVSRLIATPAAAGVEMPATLRSFAIGAAEPPGNGTRVHLDLTVQPPGGAAYDVGIEQVLPPTITPTLAAGQRLTVKVAAGDPQAVMLWNTPHAAGGADPDTGRPLDDPPPAPDPAERLEKLAALHASGALTDDEFDQQKARILAG